MSADEPSHGLGAFFGLVREDVTGVGVGDDRDFEVGDPPAEEPERFVGLQVEGLSLPPLAALEHQLRSGHVPPTTLQTGDALLAVKLPRSPNGYDRGEVDAFLGRAAAALDGRGRMTSSEVRHTRFTTTSGLRRGYQVRAVDALLDELEQELRFRGR